MFANDDLNNIYFDKKSQKKFDKVEEKEKMVELFDSINQDIKEKIIKDTLFREEFTPKDVVSKLYNTKNRNNYITNLLGTSRTESEIWKKIHKHFFYIDEFRLDPKKIEYNRI